MKPWDFTSQRAGRCESGHGGGYVFKPRDLPRCVNKKKLDKPVVRSYVQA